MGRWVGRLIKIDDTVSLMLKHGSVGRRPTAGEGCEVIGLNIQLVIVLIGVINKLSGFTFKSKGQFDVSMEGPLEEGLI